MKFSLGLTAVTLVALSGLYVAGCADSTPGMGIIDPYDPTVSPRPTPTSTATPTASPTTRKTEVFQDGLTNPIAVLRLTSYANGSGGYSNFSNYWVLQADKTSGEADSRLVRIAADTKKGKSDVDTLSPHRLTVINVATNTEIKLHNATSMSYVDGVAIKESKYEKVYGKEYNKDGQFILVSNNALTQGAGQLLVINPNEIDKEKNKVYAHVIINEARMPVACTIDRKYIWWAECVEKDARVFRLAYTDKPDEPGKGYRTKIFIQGLNLPLNIMSNGGNIYVADTGGGYVLVARRYRDDKEPSGNNHVYPYYDTQADWGIFKLGSSSKIMMVQPYGMTVLNSGRLLITDYCYNPFFSTGVTLPEAGKCRLLEWDTNTQAEESKQKTTLTVLQEGLNNVMQIVPTYDASRDFTSSNKQLADVLLPQYNSKDKSVLTLSRVNVTYSTSKKTLEKTTKVIDNELSSWVYPVTNLPVVSTDDNPQEPPKKQDVPLDVLYNEKTGVTTEYNSLITHYNYTYPF